LKELNLWTLEKKRLILDLVQCFKILTGIGGVQCDMEMIEPNPGVATRL